MITYLFVEIISFMCHLNLFESPETNGSSSFDVRSHRFYFLARAPGPMRSAVIMYFICLFANMIIANLFLKATHDCCQKPETFLFFQNNIQHNLNILMSESCHNEIFSFSSSLYTYVCRCIKVIFRCWFFVKCVWNEKGSYIYLFPCYIKNLKQPEIFFLLKNLI